MSWTRTFALVACLTIALGAAAELTPAEQQELRERAREAFVRGDYEGMARAYGPLSARTLAQADAAGNDYSRLSALRRNHLDDCMGLGHAHQLAGNWAKALAAYQGALSLVDSTLRAGLLAKPAADGPPEKGRGRGRPRLFHARDKDDLVRQRALLILLIGCLQRDELKDPQAAAATLAKGIDYSPALKRSTQDIARDYVERLRLVAKGEKPERDRIRSHEVLYPLRALRELAVSQERLGQLRAALATWSKVNLARRLYLGQSANAEVAEVARLVEKLPPGGQAPRSMMLIPLSPGAAKTTLRMDDPQALARAWKTAPGAQAWHWTFALCPPRGQEFAAFVFACDIEQLELGYGGQFTCSAVGADERAGSVNLGTIGWHDQGPPGRKVIMRRFTAPRGTRLAHISVCQWKGKFRVHSVSIEAQFRPRQDAALVPTVRIQTECLPQGGELICNGERITPGHAHTGLEPGRYAFTYSLLGHMGAFQCEAELLPGGSYGLFANLDSPFRWQLTTLRRLSQHPPARASLVRMADGRWLAAYGSVGSKIALSSSRDGANWEEAWPLPHGSAFDCIEPSLQIDEDGTIWLAYFSNRLDWQPSSSAGYHLWLTSSRDGREWSRPRPVSVASAPGASRAPWRDFHSLGGWPWGAVHMLRGPDGRHWMFWRHFAGSADSPANIRRLEPVQVENLGRLNVTDPHVAIDPGGRLHMVFSNWGRGIHYCTSADGRRWSAPVALTEAGAGGRSSNAQLILDGTRAALIYENSKGGWLRRGTVAPAAKFDPPVKITNHTIPLGGSRVCVTPEGQVALLAGRDTVWFLRADRNTLSRPVQKF